VTTNFPAELLSGLETPDDTVRFLYARLVRGPHVCAELGLTNTLPLTGMRVLSPVVDAVGVDEWAEVVEAGPGIDALDVHVDWNCSRSCPATVSLRLDTADRSAAWSSSLPVDAGGGANSTVFRYPGWLFWSANLSNALVAARFEARSPDGILLGFAENFATSRVFQASQFAGCPLPELEVVSLEVSPVTNQAGVVSGSERFLLSAVLRNAGDVAAEAVRAQGTAISDGASVLFANIAVPGLYTGEEWTVSFIMERGRGLHDISLAIDPDQKVTERNRLNNVMTRSVLIPLDTDGDGLPDLWEHTNFGDFLSGCADDDPDRDGLPNWHEFGAGTSPTNAASRFAVEAVNKDGTGLLLRWQSAPGKRYRVWWTGNLSGWDQADSEAVGETDSWQALPDECGARFFRVTIEE
jgi:hypothetical protein